MANRAVFSNIFGQEDSFFSAKMKFGVHHSLSTWLGCGADKFRCQSITEPFSETGQDKELIISDTFNPIYSSRGNLDN
jgi:hypothetical protein